METLNSSDTPDEIPESQELSKSYPNPTKFIDLYVDYVNNFFQELSAINTFSKSQPLCHTILCHGHDSVRLRLLEFIWGQTISFQCKYDVHLIRTSHLPILINKTAIRRLVQTSRAANYLSFFKIYYLEDYCTLVDQLLSISSDNKRQLLPIAFIIDDISTYIGNTLNLEPTISQQEEHEDSGPSRKRFKKFWDKLDEELQTLMRICSLLIETLEYCSTKIKQNTYLILNIDLDTFYPNDLAKQQSFIFKLTRRYFNHKINVDNICSE